MSTLAQLHRVTRRFGDVVAVDDVTLTIEAGSMVGLLGPNGAGKTSLISLINGLRRPTSGTVTLLGRSPQDVRSRQSLGSTPQETALPPTLKVGEVIDFVGRHFEDRQPTEALAEEFGLTSLLGRQTGALSGGQKRRLSVALAFVGRPKLVLLDEPTTGLDIDGRHALWAAVRRQHEAGATVVVTSHYLEEIEALAERVVVMEGGRVIADDSLQAIVGQVGVRQIRLRTPEVAAVSALPGVARAEAEGEGADAAGVVLYAADCDQLIRELVRSGLPFADLAVRGATLEEAFLTLTDSGRAHSNRAASAEAAAASAPYATEVSR
ncbi:ABC transporter ATP-binding protein [Microterricola viridarii]|uniref:ABC-2 type transport system ATP-binding protein n=1 Tax=Microterricola viridarii TaxID=412690 RepID=A0A1H1ZQ17_9MICO|nr:ABC transporter ATP-binding protein [Microterricola viridarii]SDT35512.1 ABC-2 type transport system ATP-binding protein [Microterricola viridarii]